MHGEGGCFGVWAEPGVREADGDFVVECEKQSRRIEIRLGENVELQEGCAGQLHGAHSGKEKQGKIGK